MSEMKDLARSTSEKKEAANQFAISNKPSDQPDYPYGLTLRFESDTLDKLGVKELPTPGEPMQLSVKANVVSVRSSKDEKGPERRVVELQVTHAEIVKSGDLCTRGRS